MFSFRRFCVRGHIEERIANFRPVFCPPHRALPQPPALVMAFVLLIRGPLCQRDSVNLILQGPLSSVGYGVALITLILAVRGFRFQIPFFQGAS